MNTPQLYSQRQVGLIYFDFSNAFALLPHELLLRELNDFGLSAGRTVQAGAIVT
jgi:hypothetical protein